MAADIAAVGSGVAGDGSSDIPGVRVRPGPVRLLGGRWGVPLLAAGSAALVAGLYLAAPTGIGMAAFTAYAVVCVVGTVVLTWRNDPPVRWPWACLAAAALLFLTGIAIRSFTVRPGPQGIQVTSLADLWTIAGYVCLAAFLYGLTPRDIRNDVVATLDAAAVVVTGALVTWALLVHPAFRVPGVSYLDRLTVTACPSGDILILFLLTRLYLARRAIPAAVLYITIGIVAMLIGDLGYALHSAGRLDGVKDSALSVWFVIGYASLLLTAWDRRVVELFRGGASRLRRSEGVLHRIALFVAMVLPIAIILLWPHGTREALWVGGLLTFLQTCLTFARLTVSMSRVSRQEAQAWRVARTDPVTGLPNRLRVTELITDSVAHGGRPALVLADFTTLPVFEAALGPQIADTVLASVADRLTGLGIEGTVLAHVERHTFAALLPDIGDGGDGGDGGDVGDVGDVAARIVSAFADDITLDGVGALSLPVSAATARDGVDAESLWRSVTLAAEQGQRSRTDIVAYDAHLAEAASRRLALAQALRGALARDEFQAHYQPLFAAGTRELVGYEALVRWSSPALGWVSPGEFIPIAEQTGAIVEVGTWMLQEACRQMARWRREPGCERLHISVNLAPRQLAAANVAAVVRQTLTDTGLSPDALWLEVTETDLMTDPKQAARHLDALRALGVTLAIDDFGTGYSSLEYLARFSADVLKIDRMFVAGLGTPGPETTIIEAVAALAHTMGLAVVAEGVETEVHAGELDRIGVDYLQGFLLGKPLPPAEAAPGRLREVASMSAVAAVRNTVIRRAIGSSEV